MLREAVPENGLLDTSGSAGLAPEPKLRPAADCEDPSLPDKPAAVGCTAAGLG